MMNEINRLGGFYGQATRWGCYSEHGIAPTLVSAMGEGGGAYTNGFRNHQDRRKRRS